MKTARLETKFRRNPLDVQLHLYLHLPGFEEPAFEDFATSGLSSIVEHMVTAEVTQGCMQRHPG